MKVVIEQDMLIWGINSVLDIVPSKTALPVLSNILVGTNESGQVCLTATDLDISINCMLAGAVETPGSTTVPARKFAEIVRELPEGPVVLSEASGRVTLQCQSGLEGSYALMAAPAEDFPELPAEIEGPEMVFEPGEETPEDGGEGLLLRDMIQKTSFAVSRDETRPVLNGVFWKVGGGRMTMVATDGARLVRYSRSHSHSDAQEVSTEAIVPTRALNHLVKLDSAGCSLDRVLFGQNHLMFDLRAANGSETGAGGAIRLFSRLVEGPYVDYEQVIPQDNTTRMKVPNGQFMPAVRRVSILSSAQTHQVRIEMNSDRVVLSASSQEIGGEAREELEAEYSGDEMVVGYNSNYLLDILRRIDSEEVLFELDGPMAAGIIRPAEQPEGEDYLCLLMPLRIND
ncbi:MAG: DNA polymerase III subunit beta [Gemmatimonadota bacterium]|nr:DNA polymerase III subunit beta [Gemmatimonadota bacterium]